MPKCPNFAAAGHPYLDNRRKSIITDMVVSGLLKKIGPTAARFPPKMLLLMDQWVIFRQVG
jgi:hypothetical protein